MSERSTRGPARWLIPALTLGLLAVFARGISWTSAWAAVRQADPTLLLVATVTNLTSLVVKGVRWWMFLDAAGVPGAAQAISATVAGAALNNVVIANGGDAARVALVSRRRGVSTARVLATLAFDRLGDAVSYIVMFVAVAFALPLPAELARWRLTGIALFGALAAGAAVFIGRCGPSDDRATSSPPEAADASLRSRVREYLNRVVATSRSIATAPRMVMALALSFAAWAGQWATFHFAARAAAFPISGSASLLALLTVNASFLVRLTPGNVGVFQLLYALAAAAVGLDKGRAVAVAFLIQMIQYIPVTLVGLAFASSLARHGVRAVPMAATAARTAGPKQP